MIQVFRGTFSAAHFYHQPQWTAEKNKTEFGKCFSPFGHGHDYRVELTFRIQPGPLVTEKISAVLKIFSEILSQLDHHHLNFVLPEFHKQIPTTENLALYIQDQILSGWQNHADSLDVQILKIRLFETPDLWVELNPI